MRTAFDFSPYRRSTVGFDRLFDMLENSNFGGESYPPFDLIKLDDNRYRIEVAVAGFKPDEIDITAQQNVLLVSGRKKEETDGGSGGNNYINRGIATRSFERRFALADHIQVRGADMKDGLLAIELVREIPEAMKPRKIEIGGAQPKHDQIEATAKTEQKETEEA